MDDPKTKKMQGVLDALNVNKALVVPKENDAERGSFCKKHRRCKNCSDKHH